MPLVALPTLYLGLLLYHGLLSAFYPFDLNYGEGFVLSDALRLIHGDLVWADLNQFPMVRSPYPPLYLLLVGALSGPSPSFLAARAISLGSALAIGALLAWHARSATRTWIPAVAVAGLWFGSTFVYQWAPLARVDLLGLALSLGGLLALSRRVTPLRLAASALLCCLALLTKQTYVAAPLAIVAYLALTSDRRAIWFALAVVGVVGGATLALDAATAGHYALHVLAGNAANPFELQRMAEMVGLFLGLNVVALGLAAWGLFRDWRVGRPGLVAVYVPVAVATTLTAGNVTSDVNYFLEPTAALALALPLAWIGSRRSVTVATLVAFQLAMLFHLPNGLMSQVPPGPAKGATPNAEDVRVGEQVLSIVREAGPYALVEPAGFAVLARVPVWVQPLDLVAEQRIGRWMPDQLVKSIAARRWPVIVLSYKFLPDGAMAALDRAYEQTDGLASPNGFSYFVYRPRQM